MKIPSKQEVSTSKALERKREIDEGLKIANKVDTLRKLASTEQNNLIKFRDESLQSIKEEIANYVDSRDSLQREVDALKEQRVSLQIPLDKEWIIVNLAKQDVVTAKENIYATLEGLKKSEKSYAQSLKELELERIKVGNLKASANESFSLAEKIKDEASRILDEANQETNEIYEEMNLREQQLHSKEQDILIKEIDVKNGKDANERERKEIISIKAQLADERATLERALLRTKKRG